MRGDTRAVRAARGLFAVAKIAAIAAIASIAALSGCALLEGVSGNIGSIPGLDSRTTRNLQLAGTVGSTLVNVVDAVNSPFSPEQEYYVGRSVAANILAEEAGGYRLYDDARARRYVNLVGQSLAVASPRPDVYLGYTFEILDSDEINALATPGGHIFVTRGMLRLTQTEDELAAVLAHEVAHVVHRHGLGSIRTARVISAVQDGLMDALDTLTPDQLKEVTGIFSDTTGDVLDTLVTRGYSGTSEREADATAVGILSSVGYDPYALVRVLSRMDEAQRAQYEGQSTPIGFSKTHPRPQSRINDLERNVLRGVSAGSRIDEAAAARRFESALGGV